MTLQAASCWYRAWLSSCLAVCSCCLRVKLCSITASHLSYGNNSIFNQVHTRGELVRLVNIITAELTIIGIAKMSEGEISWSWWNKMGQERAMIWVK